MKRSEYLARAGSEAKAKREAAEAKIIAERALKRLALAGDQLIAAESDFATIADTSVDPTAAELAEDRKAAIRDTLGQIGREPIP